MIHTLDSVIAGLTLSVRYCGPKQFSDTRDMDNSFKALTPHAFHKKDTIAHIYTLNPPRCSVQDEAPVILRTPDFIVQCFHRNCPKEEDPRDRQTMHAQDSCYPHQISLNDQPVDENSQVSAGIRVAVAQHLAPLSLLSSFYHEWCMKIALLD
jgi:hypothetical protein